MNLTSTTASKEDFRNGQSGLNSARLVVDGSGWRFEAGRDTTHVLCGCGAVLRLHHREGHDNGSSSYYVCMAGCRWVYSTYAGRSDMNFWRHLGKKGDVCDGVVSWCCVFDEEPCTHCQAVAR